MKIWSLGILCVISWAASAEARIEAFPIYQFKGTHFVAEYRDCNLDALCEVEALQEAMQVAVEASGAQILSSAAHVFAPNGLTMVFLLSESHASIHTYPEHGACFIDLFTCGDACSAEAFDQALREYLKPEDVISQILIRGGSKDGQMHTQEQPSLGGISPEPRAHIE